MSSAQSTSRRNRIRAGRSLISGTIAKDGPWADARVAFRGQSAIACPTISRCGATSRFFAQRRRSRTFWQIPRACARFPELSARFSCRLRPVQPDAKEGYLISLIDGRTNVEQLLKLSPFDPFTTLFNLARLQTRERSWCRNELVRAEPLDNLELPIAVVPRRDDRVPEPYRSHDRFGDEAEAWVSKAAQDRA